jgi:hypothetical protein
MRALVFGTSYCASAERLQLLERWAESLQRIAPGMDQLIVDSQSPVFDTAAHPFLSRFGPRLPCPSVPTPVPVAHRSIIGFPDNVGLLSAGGRDGWGRAFSQGLLCAMSGGYDYVVHVEGDLLTRLDLATICRLMQDRGIDALGTVTPGFGWLETGLLFFRVDFVRTARLVERYDWQHRSVRPYTEIVLSELLGGDLFLQLWRGAKDRRVLRYPSVADLHWLTKMDPTVYDAFMAGGAWPARDYGGPVGLIDPASEAASRLRQAADRGDAEAQNTLGAMYDKGQEVPRDYAEAARWYRKAADQGDAAAQSNLGVLYAFGQGVPQDYVQAHMWLNLATAQGLPAAAKNRDIVSAKMTPTQLEKAQALAAAWRPRAAP